MLACVKPHSPAEQRDQEVRGHAVDLYLCGIFVFLRADSVTVFLWCCVREAVYCKWLNHSNIVIKMHDGHDGCVLIGILSCF